MSGEIHSGAEDVLEPEPKLEELHPSTLVLETPYVNAVSYTTFLQMFY